jgi:CDP-paratose 2-epimerase
LKTLVIGGAGFIGTNAAARSLRRGDDVIVVDNLSKEGAETNLEWLRGLGPVEHSPADIRVRDAISEILERHRDAALVLHLAGQVAVTASLRDPRADFESNALGTLNVLEALRELSSSATIIYASTNKVYGELEDIKVREGTDSYESAADGSAADFAGISEKQRLDFHSPYGCSKGTADQYALDYHRMFGLRTVVFRQSCIYGPRQFGVEDQGWIAWFTIAALCDKPITIYGNGKQIRDVLYIDDLLDAIDAAHAMIVEVAGRVYNIGGGPRNVLSLRRLLKYLESRVGHPITTTSSYWRAGDQRLYVSDIRRAASDFGWAPSVGVEEGLGTLYDWVKSNRQAFQ